MNQQSEVAVVKLAPILLEVVVDFMLFEPTGKLADAIRHNGSLKRSNPFWEINCRALRGSSRLATLKRIDRGTPPEK